MYLIIYKYQGSPPYLVWWVLLSWYQELFNSLLLFCYSSPVILFPSSFLFLQTLPFYGFLFSEFHPPYEHHHPSDHQQLSSSNYLLLKNKKCFLFSLIKILWVMLITLIQKQPLKLLLMKNQHRIHPSQHGFWLISRLLFFSMHYWLRKNFLKLLDYLLPERFGLHFRMPLATHLLNVSNLYIVNFANFPRLRLLLQILDINLKIFMINCMPLAIWLRNRTELIGFYVV